MPEGFLAPPPAADPVILDRIRERLLAREYLYDHPADYRDGVAAAIEAIRAAAES